MRSLVLIVLVATAILFASPAHAFYHGDWDVLIENFITASNVRAVATDAAGNIYIAGDFTSVISVAGGPNLAANPVTERDVFVAKLTPAGTHVWSQSGGGLAGDTVTDIAVTPAGLVVVAGLTSSPTFAFGGSAVSTNGQIDGFATLFSTTGFHTWTRVFGGSFVDWVSSVDIDGTDVYLAGNFRDKVDFGTGAVVSAGLSDFFLLNLTISGVTTATAAYGGPADELSPVVGSDASGNIVFAGAFRSSVDLGNGPLPHQGGQDIVLAQFPSVGAAANWSKSYGGAGNDWPGGFTTDGNDNIFLTGGFHNTVDFGAGALTSDGDSDGFVAGFKGGDGTTVWSDRFGGTGLDYGNRVALDGARLFVTAAFEDAAHFGPFFYVSASNFDAALLELETSGDWAGAISGSGPNSVFADDVAVSGEPVVVGTFLSSMTWNTTTLTATVGPNTSYVLKLQPQTTAVGDSPITPVALALSPAFPNPLRGGTKFAFNLPAGRALQSAHILDIAGRRVRTLPAVAGETGVLSWDGRDAAGRPVGAGVYFLRVWDGVSSHRQRVSVVR